MAALLGSGANDLITKAGTILKDAAAEAQRQPLTLVPPPSGVPRGLPRRRTRLRVCFSGFAVSFLGVGSALARVAASLALWGQRSVLRGLAGSRLPVMTCLRAYASRARRGPFSRKHTRSGWRCTRRGPSRSIC